MALTIVEASKLDSGDVVRNGIIEMFGLTSSILESLPFQTHSRAMPSKYNREDACPWRGVPVLNGRIQRSRSAC